MQATCEMSCRRPHLRCSNRQQVDSMPSRLVTPQRCIMLQAIAGAILVDGDLAEIGLGIATSQGCLQVIAHC